MVEKLGSYFTTIGPTTELFTNPDAATPGCRIFSTYAQGGWIDQSR